MEEYILVIDNGGTNTKAVLFSMDGKQIAKSSFPTPKIEVVEAQREVNLNKIWHSVCQSIRQVLQKAEVKSERVVGVTCVGHGKGLYLLDKQGNTFRNGILSADNRAQKLVDELQPKAKEIQAINEQPLLASTAPILLKWMKENDPNSFEQIGSVLSAKDFVRFKLTGEVFSDYTDASGNGLLDLTTKNYEKKLFTLFGIEEMWERFPELRGSYDPCGEITHEVEMLTGLKKGTPVFGGLFDIDACALATQVLNEKAISMVAGTWSINTYLSQEFIKKNEGIMNSVFIDKKHFLIESSSATSAGNLDILLKILMDKEIEQTKERGTSIYQIGEHYLESTDASSTSILFLPFLYGNPTNSNVKAAFLNMDSSFQKKELIRSIYEGVVFSHKYHLEQLLKTKSSSTMSIHLAGGVVNSREWTQMFADVLGYPVVTFDAKELGALGGAICVSVGLNKYTNLSEAVETMTHKKFTFYPNQEEHLCYKEKYQQYQDIASALEKVYCFE